LGTVSQNCSYIVNPNYPSNYVPTSTPATVSYTIDKCSDDICRIRLDFDAFVLNAPSTVVTTQGQCIDEVMTIATTADTVVPTATTYGPYPHLCGTNTGYHSYIDLSETAADTGKLSFTISDSTNNQWKIKVTQYSCSDPCVASQAGCFQYHTGVTGTLQSYNLAGGAQLQAQNYKNCIRQEAGYCCIQYTVISYDISSMDCTKDGTGNQCAGGIGCSTDYILIPNVVNDGSVKGNAAAVSGLNHDRFCGVNLHYDGFPAVNVPIVSCDLPFELAHVTNIKNVDPAPSTTAGFSISYQQLAGNC